MSFYEESSIVITPNAYKAGTLYAVVPTSGAADMDVTRATAATRVDENGLVNYAEVIGSELVTNGDFATNLDSWSTSSWWVWNALGAYHPSTNLHKPLYQVACEIGKTYLITFDLNCVGSSLAKVSLGSSTGSTTKTFATSLPTGSYSYVLTAEAEYLIFNRQNIAEFYVNNVSVKEVIRDNVPRIDYTGGGCPHILSEPQRTNLALNSETFSSYATSNVNITSSSTLSPDGTSTAIKLALDNGTLSSNGGMSFSQSTTAGQNFSWSMFVKKAEYSYLTFSFGSNAAVGFHFDLDTGLITQVLASAQYTLIENKVESYNNGWYRISVSLTDVVGAGGRFVCVKPSPVEPTATNNNYSSTGDGTSGIYVWGAQLEEATYPTSYIPTSGATVTRNQDQFTRDGIGSLINSTEGVLFVEMAALTSAVPLNNWLTITDGTNSNSVGIVFETPGTTTARIESGGVNQVYISKSGDYSIYRKLAFKWKVNDFAFWINGVEVGSDTGGITFSADTLNSLQLTYGSGGNYTNGKINQLQVYPTALSDAELETITSWVSFSAMAETLNYTIK